ncbi:MAG TPA: sigma-70 family RNA polymerase sigma factor [Asanoa sp.]|jgi:RNA polymerase sigma factor (sigma-70 family)|nr:sigma-70 family RNA polymerase sigma factor [Asanoa sp.]
MGAADDEERFEAMYRAHYDEIGRFVRRRAADLDSDDVVDMVMTIAWQRLPVVPVDNPLPWLYQTARNVLRNEFRRLSNDKHDLHDPTGLLMAAVPASRDDASGVVDRLALREALTHLDDRDREILELMALEQLSVPEVAVVLDMKRTAVNNRVARLRKLWDPRPDRVHQLVALLGPRRRR